MGLFSGIGGVLEDLTGFNMGSHGAADKAVRAQTGAATDANAMQRSMYDQQRSDAKPWQQAGTDALSQMQNPNFQKSFTMSDFTQDPGYQFRMGEGMKAIQGSAAARGSLNSGATLKALTQYGQNFASNEYQNAYDRFNNDQNTRFNRLSQLAGYGQNANAQVGQAGQSYANAYGQNVMGAANAQAAQQMGQMNQRNDLIKTGVGAIFSDERLKTNIEPVSKEDLAELKATIRSFKFRYKNPEHGEGDWVGVMAQDLNKSRLGRSLVFADENGHLKIDLGKFASLFLATLAEV